MLTYIILFCYVSSICLVKGQSLCPVDYHGKSHSAPYYGGYSDEYTCVSFVPRHEVPQCSSEIYECLEKFCTSEFFGGHLMHWVYHYLNGYVPYKIPIEPESDGIAVFNGMILLDRVFSDHDESGLTRPGDDIFANISCMSFKTYCATDCEPLQYCTYVWQNGRASFFSSRILEFLQTKEGQKQLSTVSLPVCMTFELNDANSDYTARVDVYACKDVKFDYFACQHKKYPPCKVRKKKKCHYSPNKYGLPCDEESTETCPCPCSGEPNEWSSWSATCGTTTRYRWRPKNPEALDCAIFPDQCCREEDIKYEEDCKNYAFNSSVNLRLEDCHRGRKDVDVHGHLQCVCDPGFTDLLCATERKECKKIDTCENGGTCVERDGTFSCKCPETFGGHRCEYKVSWCNETTCNGRGICVNITSLLTWRCFCDRGFTGRQCQTVEGKIGIVTRSTKEAVGSSARIWIILVMVFTGMVLFGVGALYTTKKRRRHRRQHRSASSSVRQGLSRGRRGKWRAPVNQSSSSCVSTAKPTRGFSLLTRDMCSSLKNPEPVRNKPNRWRTQPST